jgi:hypothetical protein
VYFTVQGIGALKVEIQAPQLGSLILKLGRGLKKVMTITSKDLKHEGMEDNRNIKPEYDKYA